MYHGASWVIKSYTWNLQFNCTSIMARRGRTAGQRQIVPPQNMRLPRLVRYEVWRLEELHLEFQDTENLFRWLAERGLLRNENLCHFRRTLMTCNDVMLWWAPVYLLKSLPLTAEASTTHSAHSALHTGEEIRSKRRVWSFFAWKMFKFELECLGRA